MYTDNRSPLVYYYFDLRIEEINKLEYDTFSENRSLLGQTDSRIPEPASPYHLTEDLQKLSL